MLNPFRKPGVTNAEIVSHIAELESDEASIRANAARTLGGIGSPMALPALLRHVYGVEKEVVKAATTASARIAKKTLPRVLRALPGKEWDTQWYLEKKLKEIGLSGFPGLLDALRGETQQRWVAAWLLGLMEAEEAVPSLLLLLGDREHVESRRLAAHALMLIGFETPTREIQSAMIDRIQDPDEDDDVRSTAALTLGREADASVIALLLETLGDRSPNVRGSAATALGSTEDKAVIPALLRLIDDPVADVRHDVINALHDLLVVEGLPGLIKSLRDVDETNRYRAAFAIGEIAECTGSYDECEAAVPELVEAIRRESDRSARYFEGVALSIICSGSAKRALTELLTDAKHETRIIAANQLSYIDYELVQPRLKELLTHPQQETRELAKALFEGTYELRKDF